MAGEVYLGKVVLFHKETEQGLESSAAVITLVHSPQTGLVNLFVFPRQQGDFLGGVITSVPYSAEPLHFTWCDRDCAQNRPDLFPSESEEVELIEGQLAEFVYPPRVINVYNFDGRYSPEDVAKLISLTQEAQS